MSLSVRHETVGEIEVVAVSGAIDLATLPRFADALNRVTIGGGVTVAVDLEEVTALDDAALGTLLGTASRLRRAGRDLVLVCTNDRVVDHLRTTGVTTILPLVATLGAVGSSRTRP